MAVHWLGILGVCRINPLLWFGTVSLSGLITAIVVTATHQSEEIFFGDEARKYDFVESQFRSTRDAGLGNWFSRVVWGGMDWQLEHHLFPTMPRHHLAECNRRVRKFCKDYGVTYHETTMWQGTLEVLEHLQDIANEVIEDFPAM